MPQFKKYKLGELALDVAMGPFGSDIKTDNFRPSGVPVIRGQNLIEGGFERSEYVFISEEKAKSLKRSLAYPDDLVFTHRGTLGQVGLVPSNKYPYYLVSQSQMKLVVNKGKLVPKYLYYFFKSDKGQRELLKNVSQVGVPAIASPTKSLKDVDIEIPEDLPTQTRIVSILSSLDDKIELNRRTNHTLEQIAQKLFKKYFVDDIDPENLPDGWRWGRLDEEFNIIMGQSPEGSSYNEKKIGTPFFQGRTDFDFRFPSFRIYTTSPKRFAKKFDILLSVRAPVGDLNLALTDCCIGRGIASLRHKKSKLSYGYYKLKTLDDAFEPFNGEGTIFGSINKDELAQILVIIPSEEKIEEYNNAVRPMDDKIHQLYNETNSLTKIRDSLLPKLMSGEIEVTITECS